MSRLLASSAVAVLGLALVSGTQPTGAVTATPDGSFPPRLELPDGFQPEGIAIGSGPTAWLGSRADGDIYELSLRTGEGRVISEGPGTPSLGLKADRDGRLYVAGGISGRARVIDTETGEVLRDIALATAPTFVNDVVLTKGSAWFTDSNRAQLYRVDRGPDGEPAASATTVPLTGEWEQVAGLNANGISTTPTGDALLVVNSASGLLYRVEPGTGVATRVDLGGASLVNGDGLLRQGRTLYVVRNRLNQVAVIRLSQTSQSGRLVRTIDAGDLAANTSFDVPTTVARFGSRLYLPNARFTTTPTPTTDYWVTQVPARVGD